MPRHPDFERIYQSFIKAYGERGEEVYYRWLRKLGYDDTKPLEGQTAEEGFNWIGTVDAPAKNLIRGEALHPVKTYHPEEWPEVRVYLEEELARSAETLMGKPLLLDHYLILPPPNRVVYATYRDGALEYVAEVDDEVAGMVRDGLIRHCSVEFDWERLERLDGVAPRGIEFTGLSLLRDVEPGDPRTTVELWEGILRHLRREEKLVAGEKKETGAAGELTLQERVWTRRYINDLPDSAFAVIEPGGRKDEEGKTVPRSLRHLPHHNASGAVDIPHLRSANSRVKQMTNLSEELREKALEHLDAHKRELGIGDHGEEAVTQKDGEVMGGEVPTWADGIILSTESAIHSIEEEVEELRRRVEALEESATLSKRSIGEGETLSEGVIERNPVIDSTRGELGLVEELLGMLPESVPPGVGYYPAELVQRLRRFLLEKKETRRQGALGRR